MEVLEVEAPATFLLAAMLAHDPVKPAFQAASQRKIGRVDGENERLVDHAFIEPVRDDHLDAHRSARAVEALLPLVDPAEPVPPPGIALTDRGGNRGRLKAI